MVANISFIFQPTGNLTNILSLATGNFSPQGADDWLVLSCVRNQWGKPQNSLEFHRKNKDQSSEFTISEKRAQLRGLVCSSLLVNNRLSGDWGSGPGQASCQAVPSLSAVGLSGQWGTHTIPTSFPYSHDPGITHMAEPFKDSECG